VPLKRGEWVAALPGGKKGATVRLDDLLPERCAIGVMAKTPRPGHSKTRLCPPLSPDQAAGMSAAFLRDTMENLLAVSRVAPITGYAAYAPLGAEKLLRPHLPPDTPCVLADGTIPVPAGVEGFGRCLLHAMQALFAAGHPAACVLSSDTPTLPPAILARAADLLLQDDARRVVLGACDDGGYYLLGMRTLHVGLFAGIAWSTDTVADVTRDRAAALGLELIELPPWYDIDDGASLLRLAGDQNGYAAPRSRAALRTLGLEPGFSLSAIA
jgi:rSAM/selenodomain-associated transferase 1